jgi:hypothetical protein
MFHALQCCGAILCLTRWLRRLCIWMQCVGAALVAAHNGCNGLTRVIHALAQV